MMGKRSRGRPSPGAPTAVPAFTTPSSLSMMLLSLLVTPAAAMLRCNELQVDGHMFNLSPLAGPHAVVTSEHSPPSWFNTSYTVDVCAFLKRKGDVNKEWACPGKSRVCAIKHTWDPDTQKLEDRPIEVMPLAGDLTQGGQGFEYGLTRLSTSSALGDQGKEGIRIEMKGGLYKEREQRAVIEFHCNRSLTGLEGEWSSDDEYVPGDPDTSGAKRRTAEGQDDNSGGTSNGTEGDEDEGTQEKQLRKEDAALVWNSYGPSADGKMDVVSLTWQTKYACESVDEGGRDSETKHWGLFTWLFILAFMTTAAYLIFGSWLNYTRYGARGWDLLPHGDAIRDIPYLLKDWIRRVLNTVQSSGSRGGYSAV